MRQNERRLCFDLRTGADPSKVFLRAPALQKGPSTPGESVGPDPSFNIAATVLALADGRVLQTFFSQGASVLSCWFSCRILFMCVQAPCLKDAAIVQPAAG